MQGYILSTTRVRDEDLLVKILTKEQIYTLYRFYGARHSVVHLGHKIDFSIEKDLREIGKLREPLHLAFSWEKEVQIRYFWQQYLHLLNAHLRDITTLDSFYFSHLEEGAKRLRIENPKRCILNLYAKLLNFEGRKNTLQTCLICEQPLGDNIILGRGLVCGHKGCMEGALFPRWQILAWLNLQGEFLDSNCVDNLWNLLTQGL
ncbi:recombination protein RecO [Helicobacter winghamensis]|uniref:Recombination protein RecO n=1 Tax=Helicobacter winghamensis TaxID=157268 RepID=A0A2N3PJP2_9HELI|nr:recombination protein RecO [Helicobacter winghamensis]EEO26217.1 putative recombination protein RecO [Helicobacter winghamensis ATCC BAA-430]PKT77214.1 recombination protein RecO [Helicobacter winghamensis]PKT77413.1 recombination protein RecO [Helicobacter winghamensis]PKT77853.1 recombination protein RecO [Helicobacter winghamensis]PKT81379.1 recombination protein RecO [Helicobacter winghamensis]